MQEKSSISDYTEEDFLQLVEEIFKENVSDTDDVLNELLEQKVGTFKHESTPKFVSAHSS